MAQLQFLRRCEASPDLAPEWCFPSRPPPGSSVNPLLSQKHGFWQVFHVAKTKQKSLTLKLNSQKSYECFLRLDPPPCIARGVREIELNVEDIEEAPIPSEAGDPSFGSLGWGMMWAKSVRCLALCRVCNLGGSCGLKGSCLGLPVLTCISQ